ncbi:Uncharacterised protein g2263 [Pycnogonum litorale]
MSSIQTDSTNDVLPQFAEPIQNVTVSAGRDVKLACVVNNLGNYKVAWTHHDTKTLLAIHNRIITNNNRYSVLHNGYHTWWLHIRNVKPRDSGLFMCQINTIPMIKQVGHVEVLVPPQIIEELSSSDVNVHEGEEVNLRCVSTGYPRPKVSWEREDDNFIYLHKKKVKRFEGQDLNFTKVSRQHMGAYLCISTNGVAPSVSKRIHLTVNFSPTVLVPNQLVGALRHSDVTIECNIEAYPQPMMYWTKLFSNNEESMLVSSTKYNLFVQQNDESYKMTMKLLIRNLKQSDYGSYSCHAESHFGDTKTVIKMYEIQNPSISPKRMKSLTGGPDSAVLKYNEIQKADDVYSGTSKSTSISDQRIYNKWTHLTIMVLCVLKIYFFDWFQQW